MGSPTIYKFKKVTCVRACGRGVVGSCVRVSFISLWPAFKMTVHIKALYNESVQRLEQHSSGINTIT